MATSPIRTNLLLSACAAAACLSATATGGLAQQTVDFTKPPEIIVNFEADEEQFYCVDNEADLECSGNGEANLSGPAPSGPSTGGQGDD